MSSVRSCFAMLVLAACGATAHAEPAAEVELAGVAASGLRLAAGLGVAPRDPSWRARFGPTPEASADLMFSVRLKFGSNSQIALDQVIARPDDGLGLQFKAANATTLAGLRQGTVLRMNLSNSSTLRLRARGGKLMVQWRTQW